jgi:hypothetical protein
VANLQWRYVAQRLAPPWLVKPFGNAVRVLFALGLSFDGLMEWAMQGAQARMPGNGTPTALPHIARDRRLRRGPNEAQAAFEARLRAWIPTHKIDGTPYAVMQQIRAYASPHRPAIRYVSVSQDGLVGWLTLLEDSDDIEYEWTVGNWDWDGSDLAFTRCWFIVYPNPELWAAGPVIGDPDLWNGAIGEPGFSIGSTATVEDVQAIRTLAREFKSAASTVHAIILAFDAGDFEAGDSSPPNPDGGWEFFSKNVGGDQVAARIVGAAYWPGAE